MTRFPGRAWAYQQTEPVFFDDAEAYEEAMYLAANASDLPSSVRYVLARLADADPLVVEERDDPDRLWEDIDVCD